MIVFWGLGFGKKKLLWGLVSKKMELFLGNKKKKKLKNGVFQMK